MSMLVAVPRSLAAFPWLLMARDLPALVKTRFFDEHDLALKELTDGTVDLLCTGYTELQRFPESERPARICTYVWGLSAIVVRDGALESTADLARYCGQNAGAALVLPFAGSPARSAGSGAGFALIGIYGNHSTRTLSYLKRCNAGQRVSSVRRYYPEPIAARLISTGAGHRFADIASLWAQINHGERRSPQVSLFAKAASTLGEGFMAEFRRVILICHEPNAEDLHFLADQLSLPVPIVEAALPHVIFETPENSIMQNLEASFDQLVALAEKNRRGA
jgi:hypothetical protein